MSQEEMNFEELERPTGMEPTQFALGLLHFVVRKGLFRTERWDNK